MKASSPIHTSQANASLSDETNSTRETTLTNAVPVSTSHNYASSAKTTRQTTLNNAVPVSTSHNYALSAKKTRQTTLNNAVPVSTSHNYASSAKTTRQTTLTNAVPVSTSHNYALCQDNKANNFKQCFSLSTSHNYASSAKTTRQTTLTNAVPVSTSHNYALSFKQCCSCKHIPQLCFKKTTRQTTLNNAVPVSTSHNYASSAKTTRQTTLTNAVPVSTSHNYALSAKTTRQTTLTNAVPVSTSHTNAFRDKTYSTRGTTLTNDVTGSTSNNYAASEKTYSTRGSTLTNDVAGSTSPTNTLSDKTYSTRGIALTNDVHEEKTKIQTSFRCPVDNSNNWNFNCTVPCADMPDKTNMSDRVQAHVNCKTLKPSMELINVKRMDTIQVFPEDSECLQTFVMENCYDVNPVPNLVHYMWFSKREMNFYHFVSFLSASRFLKPCLILIHGDILPFGTYWDYLLTLVSNILHVQRSPPEEVFGRNLTFIEHKSDIARIQALQRFGGIYVDTDEIILRSLDPLRKYPFTLSRETDWNLSNGLILAEKNATFLNIWYSEYKSYNGSKTHWGFHSTQVPYWLSQKYPDLIHVENKTFVRPSWENIYVIFDHNFDWSKNYGLHYYIRFYTHTHDFNDIKYLNTTIGSTARHVLYGSKDLCEK
ncbi:unnamed protein product [Mytilus edulis]|uniref:Uncharacterized protein n=1 Tax=Mytilus edulis TaxID=6550 RepID=A0A8S3SW82_MYTED|nr:unnamed protein product [Mytilus edulis]